MIGPTNALTVTGTVDPGSVTVGSNLKPVKLVNGVATAVDNDLVSTTGNQTIGGTKTYTGVVTVNKTYYTYMDDRLPTNRNTYGSATGVVMPVLIHAVNQLGNPIAGIDFEEKTNSRSIGFRLYGANGVGWNRAIMVNDSSGIYVTMPTRTYSASNTSDVVTIGSLQASTDVVHRSGAETLVNKTLENNQALIVKTTLNYGNITIQNMTDDNTDNTKTDRHAYLVFADANNVPVARIGYTHNLNNRNIKIRIYKTDGTWFPDIVLADVNE